MPDPNQKNTMTPYDGLSLVMNLILGSAPMIIPHAFAAAGWLLSLIWITLITFLSFQSADYIIETQSICNAIKYSQLLLTDSVESTQRLDINQSIHDRNSIRILQDRKTYNRSYLNTLTQRTESLDLKTIFEMRQTFELTNMGELLYGKPGKYFNSIMTMVYLFAILMSKTIIIGTIMSGIFGSTIILGNYYFWISLFVIICGIMSLRNVAALAKIQNVFVIIRYFLITIMILGCIVIICQNGPYPLMPTFKLSKFADIYGTSIFCYMLHTSIPQTAFSIKPEKHIKKVYLVGYFISSCLILAISFLGFLAFGPSLVENQYPFFSQQFNQHLQWVYYLSSQYMFLNIVALPVKIMVLRGNLMKLVSPVSYKEQVESDKITKPTYLFTLAIIIPIFVAGIFLKDYIELVIDITGGICGMTLLLIIPGFMLLKARKILKDQVGESFDFHHEATIEHNSYVYLLISIGLLLMPYTFYLKLYEMHQNHWVSQ